MRASALLNTPERKRIVSAAVCFGTALLLSAGRLGGLYGPWALAFVCLSGGGSRGFCALLGVVSGAYLFYDFQSGLRLAASVVLIYCANMAFCDLPLAKKPYFAPALAAAAQMLVQSVYLVGRTAREWALCLVAAAVTAAAAAAMRQTEEPRHLLCVLTAVVCAAVPLSVEGFSPGRAAAVWLVLMSAMAAEGAERIAVGAGVGLAVDLAAKDPTLLFTVALAAGAWCIGVLRCRLRLLCAVVMWLAVALTVWGGESDHAAVHLYEALCGGAAFLAVPRRWCPAPAAADNGGGAREAEERAVPAMASAVLREGAAAYRALYDELLRGAPGVKAENPSVIFDGAAEAVCRDCVLAQRCWQTEYDVTFSAFNDAVGPILRRGRAEPEDFPLHFASRCVHFTPLLAAIDRGTYGYLLRRQYRSRLDSAHSLAREQYARMGEMLSATAVPEGTIRLHCRIGTSLRPREGESVCGDQLAAFTAGKMFYLLLSDGMGSGEQAHAESAMTVRLLRKFLKAGIEPRAALKTLNTALTLRCAEGGGFTTIDLLALDRCSGEAVLYKYGAAPTYVLDGGAVTRLTAGSLPAGLQGSAAEPESSRLCLKAGAVLVMVSDGLTGVDGDEWLCHGLRQWGEMEVQDLAQQILAESRRHGGLQDDCAVLVLRSEKIMPPEGTRV